MQVLFRLSEDLQTLSWEKKGLQGLVKDMAMGFGKMMLGGFAKSADTARRVAPSRPEYFGGGAAGACLPSSDGARWLQMASDGV
jgi:hypothetical protein